MSDGRAATRRGFLAVVGGSTLAGCSGLDRLGNDGESAPTVSAYRFRDAADDESTPVVAESIPVEIEASALRARSRRVDDLLGTVPIPLDAGRLPNGVIRERLLDAADDATTAGQRARSARTRFEALRHLSRARERARYAAAGWAYVETNRTEATLRAAHRRARDDARTLRADLAYRGADPVRAALVYARAERRLAVVADSAPAVHESSPLLRVAEWGERAESARASTDDARYLLARYAASLPDDAGTVENALTAAADALADDLRERRAALPSEPSGDDRDEFGWRLRGRLRDDVESGVRRLSDPVGPARAVVDAVGGFAAAGAYERVRSRLDGDGGAYRVEDAADVREARQRALDAIRNALAESPRPALARPTLADAAMSVTYADDSLAGYRGDVRVRRLHDPLRRYAAAAARAESVPAACRRVVAAL
ncbi:hypothetical protein J2752_001773 [Halarchaeum rubridurum]|uniref:Uncharacterized protein n=1 Tax=Halarchaeum rubridurum TaxID=489911 RepID=A0A830FXJ1_9EURY|nr:hypothetical protein [Halarchaeum rubridurum]MBP1954861.1 hypothetical protein [Halarchaeum rubridurum]GGM60334.1 hypothetical protein GCM10009017_08110 [Halarchaeum rubridurum]